MKSSSFASKQTFKLNFYFEPFLRLCHKGKKYFILLLSFPANQHLRGIFNSVHKIFLTTKLKLTYNKNLPVFCRIY